VFPVFRTFGAYVARDVVAFRRLSAFLLGSGCGEEWGEEEIVADRGGAIGLGRNFVRRVVVVWGGRCAFGGQFCEIRAFFARIAREVVSFIRTCTSLPWGGRGEERGEVDGAAARFVVRRG
jgi:hypothetical protein